MNEPSSSQKTAPRQRSSRRSPNEKQNSEGEGASTAFYFFIGTIILSAFVLLGMLIFT